MESVRVESPYVHRYARYLEDLKKNWAYIGTNRKPGKKKRNKKSNVQK